MIVLYGAGKVDVGNPMVSLSLSLCVCLCACVRVCVCVSSLFEFVHLCIVEGSITSLMSAVCQLQFGPISAIFTPSFVRNMTLIAPIDTGAWYDLFLARVLHPSTPLCLKPHLGNIDEN